MRTLLLLMVALALGFGFTSCASNGAGETTLHHEAPAPVVVY